MLGRRMVLILGVWALGSFFGSSPLAGVEIHVPDDFPTIQGAIEAAFPGDVIVVAAGTYLENLDFLGKSIHVRSADGPRMTVVDGSALTLGADVGSVVSFRTGEDAGAILEGLTLRGGTGSVINNFPVGGGVLCQGASPLILGNIVRGNEGALAGGGIYVEGGSPEIRDNLIEENGASLNGFGQGGGIYAVAGAPHIEGNWIRANFADLSGGGIFCRGTPLVLDNVVRDNVTSDRRGGGGLHSDQGQPIVAGCDISQNFGVGVGGGGVLADGADLSLINCRILGNTAVDALGEARGGGVACFGGSSLLAGNLVAENEVLSSGVAGGGGVAVDDGTHVLTSNSILFNVTESRIGAPFATRGGGLYVVTGEVVFSNGILWGNSAESGGQVQVDGGSLAVSFSDVQGGAPGPGNIDLDPLFREPEASDYRLLGESPCIDAADKAQLPSDLSDVDGDGDTGEPLPLDLAGNPRALDNPDVADTGPGDAPHLDMGALEWTEDCNDNGVYDPFDIAQGTSPDCNDNLQPDECDIAGGSSDDSNGNGVPDECEPSFVRGECDGSPGIDLGDALFLLQYLYLGGDDPPCPLSCDTNDDDALRLDDAIRLLRAMYEEGHEPEPPYPDCGVDPSPGFLECAEFVGCP